MVPTEGFLSSQVEHLSSWRIHFFPPCCIPYLILVFLQWLSLGFNWDNECLPRKRSRWVESWKGDFNYSGSISSNCVRSGWWHLDEALSYFLPAAGDTACCGTRKKEGKKVLCVWFEDLILRHSQRRSAFYVDGNHWGVMLPCWYDSPLKPALIWSRCVLRLKKAAFDLMWRVVRALVPFFVLPFAPSEIFIS